MRRTTATARRAAAGLTVAVLVLIAAPAPLGGPGTAAAASEGGARTRVVGRGDIVTSILGWATARTRGGRPATPRCAWRTLTDAQLEWLVSVAGQAVGLGLTTPLLDPLGPYLDGAELPDGDLQGYVCGVDTYELRFVPSAAPRSITEVLQRQMITRLPAPDPHTSPPAGAAVPVGQPVFFSIDPDRWNPVHATLSHQGVVAEVRAAPVSMRVITGDPASVTTSCAGPGRPFRADGHGSPAEQARGRDACVVTYSTASAGQRSGHVPPEGEHRPPTWLGTVTVVWSAEWRVGDGPWIDLGEIPRTRLITRVARDLTTSLQTTG